MSKIEYFDVGPYPVYFGFALDEKSFQKEMKRLKVNEKVDFVNCGASGTTHHFEKDGALTIIVCIKDWETRSIAEVCGLIIHEAVHVWQAVLEFINEKENVQGEMEAYHIQNISQCMIDFFCKKRKIKG